MLVRSPSEPPKLGPCGPPTVKLMSNDTTPQGVPFNFHGILDVVLIPRVIAADPTLSPGTRLLWGVIRRQAWKDGWCRSTDAELASALGVLPRQARKYLVQLTRAGLLSTRQRPGTTPERALMLTDRFKVRMAGTAEVVLPRQPPSIGAYHNSAPPPRSKRTAPPVQKDRPPGPFGPPYIRNKGSSEGSSEGGGFFYQVQDRELNIAAAGTCAEGAPAASDQVVSTDELGSSSRRPTLQVMEEALNLVTRYTLSYVDAVRLVEIHPDPIDRESAAETLSRARADQAKSPGKSST